MSIMEKEAAFLYSQRSRGASRAFDGLQLSETLRTRTEILKGPPDQRVVQKHNPVVEVLVVLRRLRIVIMAPHLGFGGHHRKPRRAQRPTPPLCRSYGAST